MEINEIFGNRDQNAVDILVSDETLCEGKGELYEIVNYVSSLLQTNPRYSVLSERAGEQKIHISGRHFMYQGIGLQIKIEFLTFAQGECFIPCAMTLSKDSVGFHEKEYLKIRCWYEQGLDVLDKILDMAQVTPDVIAKGSTKEIHNLVNRHTNRNAP